MRIYETDHNVPVPRSHGPSSSRGNSTISLRAEMLLYMAARAQLVDEVIRPALEADKVVVCDRYLLANIVYQGHAGGLNLDAIREVGRVATEGVMPDCIFLLDMPAEAADRRLSRRRITSSHVRAACRWPHHRRRGLRRS